MGAGRKSGRGDKSACVHGGTGWKVTKAKCRQVWPLLGARSCHFISACIRVCISVRYVAGNGLVEDALEMPSRRLPQMVGCVRPRFR